MPKGCKEDRQQKHIKESMMESGMPEEKAERVAWAKTKHPKGGKKRK